MNIEITPSLAQGTLAIPSSKSMAHRALICAGLADGKSLVRNVNMSKDIEATISCLRSLGANISLSEKGIEVQGINPANLAKPASLHANESGSTLRFFIPIAALSSEPVTFTGEGRLLSRPMGIYADLFARQNLHFEQSAEKIVVQGPLAPGLFEIPGDVSSQFITGLLFSAPLMNEGSEIAVLPPYESKSYVDLTLSMLEKFGIQIEQPSDHGYIIAGNQSYIAQDLSVEGDFSQLAFFAVLAALNAKLTCTNIDPNSLQGDKAILDFVKQAGAKVEYGPDFVSIAPQKRQAIEADLANVPDLGPILFVLASFLPGTSRFYNCARLRYKESDRIAAMEQELRKWGVEISSTENEVIVKGKENYTSSQPVVIDTHNDHRIAMAMSVFGLCAQSKSIIENAQVISKSFPDFYEVLKSLNARVSEV
jgi:3-phosphoshikimate 1-carboxyvinyltransferase